MKLILIALAAVLAGAARPTPDTSEGVSTDPWADVPLAEKPLAGTPNLSGVWQMPAPVRVLKTVDGKDPPLLPAAKAEYARRMAALKADPDTDPSAKCWMQGVPRLIYAPYPVLIAQERDRLNFVYETNHTFRVVSLQRPLPQQGADLDPQWLGYSAARWEGKALVIDTIGFNDKTWLDYSGLPHGEKLKVQERYTLASPTTIKGEVTITDPDYYSAPWKTGFTLTKQQGSTLAENVCTDTHKM